MSTFVHWIGRQRRIGALHSAWFSVWWKTKLVVRNCGQWNRFRTVPMAIRKTRRSDRCCIAHNVLYITNEIRTRSTVGFTTKTEIVQYSSNSCFVSNSGITKPTTWKTSGQNHQNTQTGVRFGRDTLFQSMKVRKGENNWYFDGF